MQLPVELLRTLVAFADSQSLSETAAKLGISQPAVSFQLKKLEELAPIPLFGQEGKRKTLTHYGRELARQARRQMGRLDRAIEALERTYLSAENLILRVGARREIFPRVAAALHFTGTIALSNLSSDRAIRRLSRHKIDVAFSHWVPELPGVTARKIFSNGVRLVVHERWLEGEPLTPELVRDPAFLLGTPALAYRSNRPFLDTWLRHVDRDAEKLKLRYVCQDWNMIMRFVEDGAGYSLVPEDIECRSKNVRMLPLPKEIIPHVTYYALYDVNLTRIPAFQALFG